LTITIEAPQQEIAMKVKITACVHYKKYSWEEEGEFEVFSFKFDDDDHRTFVCEQEIEIDVPDNYDPRAQQVAALEKKKRKIMADYQKMVTDINDQISKLQAIEYTS
jgi:hypothetical protein